MRNYIILRLDRGHMTSRRRLLQLLGSTGVVGPLAGCTGDGGGGSSGDGGGSSNNDMNGDGPSSSDGDGLGEPVTFSGDPGELTITPIETRLTDYLIGLDERTSTRRGLASRIPDSGAADSDAEPLFLRVKLRLEYAGSDPIGYPQYGFGFESGDGTQYDRVKLEQDSHTTYNFPIPRRPPVELSPDTETEVWIVFPVPSSMTAGTLIADLEIQGFLDAEPREWRLRLENVESETHEFDDLALGESATVGNSNIGLTFTAREVREETGRFDYSYSGETFTSDPPPEGEKYVFVDMSVENIGEEGVVSPPRDEMSLSGADVETGAVSYQGDDAYNRGDREVIDAGATKSGYVVFRVPVDVEQFTVSVDATLDITVSWKISQL